MDPQSDNSFVISVYINNEVFICNIYICSQHFIVIQLGKGIHIWKYKHAHVHKAGKNKCKILDWVETYRLLDLTDFLIGLDDLSGSHPIPKILWFCDFFPWLGIEKVTNANVLLS